MSGSGTADALEEFTMEAASMRPSEYACLREVLRDLKPKRTLEIGMANGTSTLVCCQIVREVGGERHTAVDPFQSKENGWKGQGIKKVQEAGFGDLLEVVEDFDYNALPMLVKEGRKFDFVLIDGYHSFDYTFLDMFYADLLLEKGGVLACHDTGYPCVFKALRFLETHKPYERIGPPIAQMYASPARKVLRRLGQVVFGTMAEAKERREVWHALGAWKKLDDHQVAEDHPILF
ncbi:MAG: hypothetical protein CMJ83_07670 [Planctomycetes bacterium]|nr:hypothetical protein [Planctomycetota bacterium]